MNINCKTAKVSTLSNNSTFKPKPVNSLIHISKDENNNAQLTLTSSRDPNNSILMELNKSNVASFHFKLIEEGKLSINFKRPPVMLMLSEAKPEKLRILLNLMKDPSSFSIKDLDDKAVNSVTKPKSDVLSMSITNLKQYPSFTGVGFPKTLTSLSISNVKYRHLDLRICSLPNLKVLDVSHNSLKKVPARLYETKLEKLYLNHNNLTELSAFIDNDLPLFKSLNILDLSNNDLEQYPDVLNSFFVLHTLKLSHNPIRLLSHQIQRHHQTLRILSISTCRLSYLPQALNHLSLTHLEISDNNFPPPLQSNVVELYKQRYYRKLPTLRECCVRSVIRHAVPYRRALPPYLVRYVESAQNCASCYRIVMETALVYFGPANLRRFASSYSNLARPVPMAMYCCSETCFRKVSTGKRVVPAALFFRPDRQ